MVGVWQQPVCPALPPRDRSSRRVRLGGQAAAAGGPLALMNSSVQALSQGQSRGRCIRMRRAERASRAGTAISWARMVAVVALAWNVEARTPAARVRLKAIAASTVQAPLAEKDPRACAPTGRLSHRR